MATTASSTLKVAYNDGRWGTLGELHSYGMVDGDWNSAPSADTFVNFARRWSFVRFAGSVHNGFAPEEISGVIPQNLTREQVLEFVSDAIKTFGYADEKEINPDGYFRFWFD